MGRIENNQAAVSYSYTDNNQSVVNKSSETYPVSAYVRTVGDLSIEKYSSPQYLEPGDKITYTIIITNNTVDPVTGIVVNDELEAPAKVTYNQDVVVKIDGVVLTPTTDYTVSYTEPDLTITFLATTAATLASESKASITFTVNSVSTIAAGTVITNNSTAVLNGTDYTASASSTVSYGRIDMTKELVSSTGTILTEVKCDETAYYRLTFTNTGDKPAEISYDGTAVPPAYGFTDTFAASFLFDLQAGETAAEDCIHIGDEDDPLSTANSSLQELQTAGSLTFDVSETSPCHIKIGEYIIPAAAGGTPTTKYMFIKGKFTCA